MWKVSSVALGVAYCSYPFALSQEGVYGQFISENSLVFRTLRGAFMQGRRIIEIENESTFSSVQIVNGAKGS